MTESESCNRLTVPAARLGASVQIEGRATAARLDNMRPGILRVHLGRNVYLMYDLSRGGFESHLRLCRFRLG